MFQSSAYAAKLVLFIFFSLLFSLTAARADAEADIPLEEQRGWLQQTMETCTAKKNANMSAPQCSCFLREAQERGYSRADIGHYAAGRKEWEFISDRSVKMDMAGLQIECLGEATTAFYDGAVADYKAKLAAHEEARNAPATGGSGGADGSAAPLEPLPRPAVYTAGSLRMGEEQCPQTYARDAKFCACLAEESPPWLPQAQFEVLFGRFYQGYDMVSNAQARKFEEIREICLSRYKGKIWTVQEASDHLDERVRSQIRTHEPLPY